MVSPSRLGTAGPRRVLHLVLDLHEGGLERVVTDLVLGADPARTDARVVCLTRRGQLADELPADRVVLAPRSRSGSLLLPLSLAATLRSLAPHLVHLHSGVWFKAAYASRLSGLGPIVFTDHGRHHPDLLSSRVFDRLGAAFTDRVVAVSQPLAEYLHRRLRIPRRKIEVIANGIRLRLAPSEAEIAGLRAELGLAAGVPIIGAVGRLDAVKAQDFLLTAFKALRTGWTDGPPPILILAGDGPERDRLHQQALLTGMADAVRFLGWRTDVPALLGLFDLFLLPSDSEGTSISLLEAMGAGGAVVATAVGGTPDVLGPDLGAQLVRPRDVDELVKLMKAMLLDADRRTAVGRIGRERVRSAYSVDAMVRAYDGLYDDLLAGSSS